MGWDRFAIHFAQDDNSFCDGESAGNCVAEAEAEAKAKAKAKTKATAKASNCNCKCSCNNEYGDTSLRSRMTTFLMIGNLVCDEGLR
jgi:hypothetical protein